MNRQLVLGAKALSTTQQTATPIQLSRSLSSHTTTYNLDNAGSVSAIGEWLASFNNNVKMVPSSIVKTKHDPSTQGNKSRPSQKIICRAPIDELGKCVPPKVLQRVQGSSHYSRGSDAIVTTSDKTTSANANRQDCVKKVHDIIRETAKELIAEDSRGPPKRLPKIPPRKWSFAEKKSYQEQKSRRNGK